MGKYYLLSNSKAIKFFNESERFEFLPGGFSDNRDGDYICCDIKYNHYYYLYEQDIMPYIEYIRLDDLKAMLRDITIDELLDE